MIIWAQLTSLRRGNWTTRRPDSDHLSGTQDFTQSWTLDGNGNWTAFSQTSATDPTLDQTRTPNASNQITAINSTGPGRPGRSRSTTAAMPAPAT